MTGEWLELITWRDLLDIALVALVIYNLLLLIRGTRAVQVLLGILFLSGIYYLAGVTGLKTLQALLRSLVIILPIAIIVLFQQEIRRALASVGRNPLFGLPSNGEIEPTINEIVLAVTAMARKRIGALIVVQRLEGLKNFIENGIILDAKVSCDLLMSIFTPDNPLHDGAVIIQDGRVAAAASFLPLTPNPELSIQLGTRHRAALGVSEETDALAVVVSEETGAVSIAINGKIIQGLDAKALRNTLFRYLVTELKKEGGA
ncbi:MAG: diadenylate cyclase CdaA [Thermoanaerobaculia bacterium]|nr:diadenylate cyclase CdaA [Thermoanaerobaculia bacterium]